MGSLEELLADPKALQEVLDQASPELKREIEWLMTARPAQIPPSDNSWTYWVYRAGRGAGKTRSCSEWIRKQVEIEGRRSLLLVGKNASNARDIMVKGPSGILAACPTARFLSSESKVIWENGAEAKILTSEEPESIRGFSVDCAWFDEISSWKYERDTWRNAIACVREGQHPQIVITSTPQRSSIMKEIEKYEDTYISTSTTYDNKDNLAPTFLRSLETTYKGTNMWKQEILGEYLEQMEGAIWRDDDILHLESAKDLEDYKWDRGVIAIDPAVTNSEDSDETGMIVASALGEQAFIHKDLSGKMNIDEWAWKAIRESHRTGFPILVESNQGGDIVVDAINQRDPMVKVKTIRSINSKPDRLASAAMFYEQHRVFHAEVFADLELQMISWEPPKPGKSAKGLIDRADALSHAIRYLLGKKRRPAQIILPRLSRIGTTNTRKLVR